MIVEPFANDKLEDNLNPDRPRFYARFDHALHAGVLLSGSRTWGSARRQAKTRLSNSAFGRIHARAPRRGNAFQYRPGSA